MNASVSAEREPRRALILGLVVVALAAGVVAGRAHTTRAARPKLSVVAAQRPSPGALSTAWYCPGLPGSFPTGDQTLTLSNLGGHDADAVVTVQPDNGAAPIVRDLSVARYSAQSFDRATLAPVPTPTGPSIGTLRPTATGVPVGTKRASGSSPPKLLPSGPVVVEPFSPDVVVSAGMETGGQLDTAPCADNAATDWYFAAGSTVRGVSQWLVLDDPYSTDARVDVTLQTDTGLQQLPALQGIDVPGRSRVVIAMHDQDVRQARVAVQVHAAVGRVVAAQTLQFGTASGPIGLTSSIGALAPSGEWWFTDGEASAGASQWVAVSDLSQVDVHVAVQAILASKAIVQPVVLDIQAGTVSWVQVGRCQNLQSSCLAVPQNDGYELQVQSDNNMPVVAETLSRFGGRKVALGATTSMGSTEPARDWVIARTRVADERSTSISVMNAGVGVAHISVAVVHGGIVDRPVALQRLAIAPNTRTVLPADTAGATKLRDAAVEITSDAPVFVESTIYGQNDASRAPGIPSP